MIQEKTNWPEVIARLMMILVGFIVAMLGIITAIHSEHHVLGLLISFGGVMARRIQQETQAVN